MSCRRFVKSRDACFELLLGARAPAFKQRKGTVMHTKDERVTNMAWKQEHHEAQLHYF